MNWNGMKRQEGMVVVIVMMILMATIILGMGSLAIVHTDIKISGNYRDTKAAFFAAEAGIERSLASLRANTDWVEGFEATSMANGSSYTVSVDSPAGWRRAILAEGHYGRAVRKIEIVVDIDSVFRAALNAGGNMILKGKPRISSEGIRANGQILLELDEGTPPLYVQIPSISDITLESACYGEGDMSGELEHAMGACDVYVTETPPMDFDSVRLTSEEWQTMASAAPEGFYYDLDGVFNSKDTDVTLNNFNCDDVPAGADGKRTMFVDGDVTFSGELSGTCTVVSTGKIVGTGGFVTKSGTTVSMVAMDDVLINYDTNAQSTLNGLVYTEGDYEMHGKIKFTGVVTAIGNVSAQNPSEFTNNNDPNYWYTYSSAYSIIADPIDIVHWHEVFD